MLSGVLVWATLLVHTEFSVSLVTAIYLQSGTAVLGLQREFILSTALSRHNRNHSGRLTTQYYDVAYQQCPE